MELFNLNAFLLLHYMFPDKG